MCSSHQPLEGADSAQEPAVVDGHPLPMGLPASSHNEAAEQLGESLARSNEMVRLQWLHEALAAEHERGWMLGFAEAEPQHRRATVERIRERLHERVTYDHKGFGNYENRLTIREGALDAILDEELRATDVEAAR